MGERNFNAAGAASNLRSEYLYTDCLKRQELLSKGLSKSGHALAYHAITDQIIESVRTGASREAVTAAMEKAVDEYAQDWFESPVALAAKQEKDKLSFNCFIKWLFEELKPLVTRWIPGTAKEVVRYPDGSELRGSISFGVERYERGKDGAPITELFVVRRKNFRGYTGYSISGSTPLEYNPDALYAAHWAATHGLSEASITMVFVETKPNTKVDKNGDVHPTRFEEGADNGATAGKNVQRYDYPMLRTEGRFDIEKIQTTFFNAQSCAEKHYAPRCDMCAMRYVCKAKPISDVNYPFSVVPVDTGTKPRAVHGYPNMQQGEIVYKARGKFALICGPGTGKTWTIVENAYNILNRSVSAAQMLIVVFSEKAAEEIVERLSAKLANRYGYSDDEVDLPLVCTLHSFAYDVLRSNRRALNSLHPEYEPFEELAVATPIQEQAFAAKVLNSLPPIKGFSYESAGSDEMGYPARFLKKRKEYMSNRDAFLVKARKSGLDVEAFESALLEYEKLLEGYVTFDAMLKLCAELVDRNATVAKRLQKQYPYVFVDEAQDLDANSSRIIEVLAGTAYANRYLCLVGDEDQSIFSFRGASADALLNAEKLWGASVVKLSENYRSTEEILSYAEGLMRCSTAPRYEKELKAKKSGEKPVLLTNCSVLDVDAKVREFAELGVPLKEIAVIARQKKDLEEIDGHLSVPTQMADALAGRDPVVGLMRDLYSIYYKGLDEMSLYHLCRIMAPDETEAFPVPHGRTFSEALFDLIDYRDRQKLMSADAHNPLIHVLQFVAKAEDIIGAGVSAIQTVRSILYECGLKNHVILGTLRDARERNPHLDNNEAMFEYLDTLCRFPKEEKLDTYSVDAVQLWTAHGSKGKEFTAVIIWKPENFKVESYGSGSSGRKHKVANEEDCSEFDDVRKVHYVAVTRAREYLVEMCARPNQAGLNVIRDILDQAEEGLIVAKSDSEGGVA